MRSAKTKIRLYVRMHRLIWVLTGRTQPKSPFAGHRFICYTVVIIVVVWYILHQFSRIIYEGRRNFVIKKTYSKCSLNNTKENDSHWGGGGLTWSLAPQKNRLMVPSSPKLICLTLFLKLFGYVPKIPRKTNSTDVPLNCVRSPGSSKPICHVLLFPKIPMAWVYQIIW